MSTVRDLMTADPATIDVEATLLDAWALMDRGRFRHLPVVDGDELVGVISERDVLRTGGFAHPDGPEDVLARLGTQGVREVMAAYPETVEADTPIAGAATTMLDNQFGCLPVVEGSRVVGILTSSDFLRAVVAS